MLIIDHLMKRSILAFLCLSLQIKFIKFGTNVLLSMLLNFSSRFYHNRDKNVPHSCQIFLKFAALLCKRCCHKFVPIFWIGTNVLLSMLLNFRFYHNRVHGSVWRSFSGLAQLRGLPSSDGYLSFLLQRQCDFQSLLDGNNLVRIC